MTDQYSPIGRQSDVILQESIPKLSIGGWYVTFSHESLQILIVT